MTITRARALVSTVGTTVLLLASTAPAWAQSFTLTSDLPIGETYRVELMAGMWSPSPQITVSSDAFGIAGTDIDFGTDLGIGSERFGEVRLRLRPGRKHRLRIDYIPIRYAAQTTVERRLVFRGIAYDSGVPVSSAISATG